MILVTYVLTGGISIVTLIGSKGGEKMNIEVNYFAILLSGVVSMAVGFFWYSPMLFGKQWMKLSGYTEASMKDAKSEMGKTYGISFVLTLVSAYILSHVIALSENFYHYPALQTGLTSAFMMWFGFVAPVQATDVLFGKKVWKLFGINTGYQLVSLLSIGLVIGFFG